MLFIGLTGSIATGKSFAAKEFSKLGCYVIDADQLAHKTLMRDSNIYRRIVNIFGDEIVNESGDIDRNRLGKIVLNDKEKLKLLEDMVHPEVKRLRNKEIDDIIKKDKNAIIIYDVPLLFEKKMQNMFDYTIVVYAPFGIQIKRLMARNSLSYDKAKKRISIQMSISKKVESADFVIDNSGSVEKTKNQIKEIFNRLKKKSCI